MPKRHILVVDDEADFAETMATRLEMQGYEVEVVHSGEEGLKKAQEKPDVVLLDVNMPVMNGHEVCQKLRQDSITKDLPIIMLTAKKSQQDKIGGLQIGADDYVVKSSDIEELVARIEALLRRSGLAEKTDEDKASLIEELRERKSSSPYPFELQCAEQKAESFWGEFDTLH